MAAMSTGLAGEGVAPPSGTTSPAPTRKPVAHAPYWVFPSKVIRHGRIRRGSALSYFQLL